MSALLVLFAGTARAETCTTRWVEFYTEVHSFEVSAPEGWCLDSSESGLSCFPAGPGASEPAIVVRSEPWVTLAAAPPDLDVLAPLKLAALAPGASSREQPAIRTRGGNAARVWQLSGPQPEQQRLVALLIHKSWLFHFAFEGSGAEIPESHAKAFAQLVSSFHADWSTSPELATQRVGHVCLAAAPTPTPGEPSLSNPTGGLPDATYAVQLDALPPIELSRESGQWSAPLSLGERHTVSITQDARPAASFHFTFESLQSTQPCLFLSPLYRTWQLWPLKQTGDWCVCGPNPEAPR